MKVTYLDSARVEYEPDVGFVENTFFSKISFSNGLPDLLAFTGTSDQRSRLLDELVDFGFGVVCEGAQSGSWASHARGGSKGLLVVHLVSCIR